MIRIVQDTGRIEFDSLIPAIGSKENPQVIDSSEYINLENPKFIGQSKVNFLG